MLVLQKEDADQYGSDTEGGEWTVFKTMFKKYKKRKPLPEFADVIGRFFLFCSSSIFSHSFGGSLILEKEGKMCLDFCFSKSRDELTGGGEDNVVMSKMGSTSPAIVC